MTTSPLGRSLRRLGFEKMPAIAVSQERKALNPPSFSALSDPPITYATDERGQSWVKNEVVDLSSLGFNNTSPHVREVSETMGWRKKSH